ncbi:MAG: winged helix-turn-helix domain-containing protein [Blautia sp.]|nr:winged helix-turn-helix domain-containing protein [Blautia sp.]
MDDSIRKQIMGIRSKYCEPILKLLAQEGELYHGDLAEKLNMAPSGLNSIIKKMQECSPPIIEIMQIGKYKIYTLPPNVKEYMESRENEKGAAAGQEHAGDSAEEENVLLCMQHFVEKAGEQWRDILHLLLRDLPCDAGKETRQQYDKLMRCIVEAGKYREEELDELNRFIHNEVLESLIKDYLKEIEECEEILRQIGQRERGERLLRHFRLQ